jgi:hypothetical protein
MTATGQMALYGGEGASGVLGDTWIYGETAPPPTAEIESPTAVGETSATFKVSGLLPGRCYFVRISVTISGATKQTSWVYFKTQPVVLA